jgi:hypothetical protein
LETEDLAVASNVELALKFEAIVSRETAPVTDRREDFVDRLLLELLGPTNLARVDFRGTEGIIVGPHLDGL